MDVGLDCVGGGVVVSVGAAVLLAGVGEGASIVA